MPKSRSVTPAFLRGWRIAEPDSDSDKNDRGMILVAGGSRLVPGGLILCGLASLRAGAGKLQLAAPESISVAVGIAVFEALVTPLSEARDGSLGKEAGRKTRELGNNASAVVIGPGMIDEKLAEQFTAAYLADPPGCPLVIDAACLGGLSGSKTLGPNVLLTPHSGEMAGMLGVSKKEIERNPAEFATTVSKTLGAVVVLKGATTFIATPEDLFTYQDGDVGLATSGSGDVLAGVIGGLLARGAEPVQAAAWGVAIHGAAGNALKRRVGKIGYLARELLEEIPRAMLDKATR